MLNLLAPFYIFTASDHWKIVTKLIVINCISEESGPFCLSPLRSTESGRDNWTMWCYKYYIRNS